MAITASQVFQNGSTTDANNYNTASLTAAANKLYLLVVAHGNTGGATTVPTATGGGLGTWVLIESNQQGTGNQRLTVLRAMSAAPGAAAAINIDFAGVTQHNCSWKVIEFDGVKTTGTQGADAIVESVQGDDSGTTHVVSLAGVTAGNATFGALVCNTTSPTFTADTGFVLLGTTQTATTPSVGLVATWSEGGTNPVSIDSDGTPISALIGIELARAGIPLAAASASAFAVPAAPLLATRTIEGVSASVSTAAGSITAAWALAGASASAFGTTGALNLGAAAAGVSGSAFTTLGSLIASWALAGASNSAFGVTGTLDIAKTFTGASASIFTAAGALGLARPIEGVSASVSTATGSLGLARPIAGAAASAFGVVGDLTVEEGAVAHALEGVITSSFGVSGAMSATLSLAGAVTSVSTTEGSLGLERPLEGVISSVSTATATLLPIRGLAGEIASVSTVAGSMDVALALAGAAASQFTLAGAMQSALGLAGVSASAFGVPATALTVIFTPIAIAGASNSAFGVAGSLNVHYALAGVVEPDSGVGAGVVLEGRRLVYRTKVLEHVL